MSSAPHRHHVDGRLGPGLAYIDDRLTVALESAEHARLHLVLDDLGASWPNPDEPLLNHRARRHAITFGWAADHNRALTFDAVAARSLQRVWLEVVDALGRAAL